jgi:argininosuccinate synthase
MQDDSRRIVMPYSGEPGALGAVPVLGAKYGAEVVAVALDAGQGKELEAVRDRALDAGAVRAHVLDVRDEFTRGYILPALRAGALHRDGHSAVPALERSLIAAKLLEVVRIEQSSVIAHGWVGEDRTAFERAMHTLDPALRVLAPARAWADREAQLPVRTARDPRLEPASIDLAFSRGVPTALNGIEMPLADLVANLGTIASAHGIPAAGGRDAQAHRTLQAGLSAARSFRASADVVRFFESVSREYAELIDDGRWFSPLRNALDAFVAAALEPVSALVRIRLFEGELQATAEELPAKPLALVQVKA